LSCRRPSTTRRLTGLARERRAGRGPARLTLQRAHGRARARTRGLGATARASRARRRRRTLARRRLRALRRRSELHPGAARFAQADGDRLLRRARAMLAFTNVMHLLTDELPGLGRRPLAFAAIAPGSFDRCVLWHFTS